MAGILNQLKERFDPTKTIDGSDRKSFEVYEFDEIAPARVVLILDARNFAKQKAKWLSECLWSLEELFFWIEQQEMPYEVAKGPPAIARLAKDFPEAKIESLRALFIAACRVKLAFRGTLTKRDFSECERITKDDEANLAAYRYEKREEKAIQQKKSPVEATGDVVESLF